MTHRQLLDTLNQAAQENNVQLFIAAAGDVLNQLGMVAFHAVPHVRNYLLARFPRETVDKMEREAFDRDAQYNSRAYRAYCELLDYERHPPISKAHEQLKRKPTRRYLTSV